MTREKGNDMENQIVWVVEKTEDIDCRPWMITSIHDTRIGAEMALNRQQLNNVFAEFRVRPSVVRTD